MSNKGRPTAGLKPCPHCGSGDRDSNGQCRCRNVLYRLTKGLNPRTGDKARARDLYNETLAKKGGTVEKATAALRAEFPAPARKVREAKKATAKKALSGKAAAKKAAAVTREAVTQYRADKVALATVTPIDARAVTHALKDTGESFVCLCGFEGKGTAPSVRSHVAREVRNQNAALL